MIYTGLIQAYIQRGVGDKAVNQPEKLVHSKLEAIVARQIQAQFQTSGKQALQVCVSRVYSVYPKIVVHFIPSSVPKKSCPLS